MSARREAIVSKLLDVFCFSGFDGTSLAMISKATGLGKASLYHHFPGGKEEMARAAFQPLKEKFDRDLLSTLRTLKSPEQKLSDFTKALADYYDHGNKNCLLSVFVLSGGQALFALELKSIFLIWQESVARVMQETGLNKQEADLRSFEFIARIQGALILARGTGDTGLFEQILESIAEEFTSI